MKKIFFLLCFLCFLWSCKKTTITKNEITSPFSNSSKSNLKKEFSKILVKALASNVSFRTLVKMEALKQFDNDYDVLYENIKFMTLSNGETVRSLLLSYANNKSDFLKIEDEVPLLTLFIPILPENSFSAQKWNVDLQIPEVGATLKETNDVTMYKSDGSEYILACDLIPSFPVVVVKECERIVCDNASNFKKVTGSIFEINKKKFRFLNDYFNANKNMVSYRLAKTLDPKLIDAYNIYLNTDGWQRDYIYYNISPTTPTGSFSYNFTETITTFSMQGAPYPAYFKISDQTGDPIVPIVVPRQNSGWTEGNYEFKVTVLFNAKNGLGATYDTYFSARPFELFKLTYSNWGLLYKLSNIELTEMSLNLPIFKWDLNQYASAIKIEAEEVDISESITQTEVVNTKFAANFAIDVVLKKIGLKFGASLEQTSTSTFTKVYSLGNDKLGSVIVNFADKVIIRRTSPLPLVGQYWVTQDYNTGFFKLSLEPVRVQ